MNETYYMNLSSAFPVPKSRWIATSKALYKPDSSLEIGPKYAIDNVINPDLRYTFRGPDNSILGEWLQVLFLLNLSVQLIAKKYAVQYSTNNKAQLGNSLSLLSTGIAQLCSNFISIG